MMPYRILWNGIKREGVKASSGLAFGLFYYVPLHRIRYGICWLVQREKLLYTFAPNFSHMGSVHERKKLLSFADVVERSAPPSSDVQGYDQLGFEGFVSEEHQEVMIENLKVLKLPQVKKIHDRYEWSCNVVYQQDLWHQEDYGEFVLHALHNADAAIALRIKPHDLLSVRGVAWDQRIELYGGKRKTIHHLNVTDLVIQKRAPVQTALRRK
jgi:hypothetical protein